MSPRDAVRLIGDGDVVGTSGGLFWGFNADWDAVPDLHDVVGVVETEGEMHRAAPTGSHRRR